MKKIIKSKGLQKATAILLTVVMVLSVFAVIPADLFKVSAATTSERLELDFNNNWKFNLGNVSGANLKAFDDSTWGTVELPHDFSISQEFFSSGTEAESGNLPGGTGWYRKMFVMPTEYRGKSIILNFDGVYKDTYVYVNGELVGENHYGYNSFSFDITEHLICNGTTANLIAVKVEHQLPSSRWYSGSGIYRDVTMTIVDPVHVDLYGTYVTTPNLESSNGADGTVNAEITLVNTNVEKTVTVEAQILDASGNAVGTAASVEIVALVNTETTVTLTPTLENPTLWNSWDLGEPYLYTLRTTVFENGTAIDVYDTEFGYRWFNWDLDGGFSLNGTNVKLEGVCMHHDQGALGSVQVYDAIYRQVEILKDMGCNAIRTSHGTPSRVFMEICNEMGMLVMNEFFDGWDTAKNSNSNDFSVYFDQTIDTSTNEILNAEDGQMWYEFVLTQSVKRDRNDPAIVIWDVGNELAEGASVGDFGTIAANMRDILDTLDPTRPVCQGNNQRNVTSSWPLQVEQYMTVVGGNYQPATWAGMYSQIAAITDAKTGDVGNPFVMTETTSATSTRGVYDTLSHYTYVCSGYDTDYVSWGTSAAGTWYTTITNDWFSGAFVWTGFDYIGEPTHWNHTTGNYGEGSPVSSFFGIIDTAGFAKDTYYLYRSLWNEHSNTLHLVPGTWDSNELALSSGYANVAVYSNADHIELLRNGSVIATAQSTTTTTAAGHTYKTWAETVTDSSYATTNEFYTGTGKDLYPQFTVKQSDSDTISVKAYDANNNEITDAVGTKEISAVEATKVVATTWSEIASYTADGDSYIYVELEAQDANGNFDSTYNGTATVTLSSDAAEIVGVDNGNQTSVDKFQQTSVFTGETSAQVQLFNGKAVVLLRTNETVDDAVELTFTAENVAIENNVSITSAAETGDELSDEFEEVVDQSNLEYEPTIYDEYEALYNALTNVDGGEVDYTLYSAIPDGTVAVNMEIPDGWYIITGADDQGGAYSSGVLTHNTHSSGGFASDGSTGVPAEDSDAWYFEKTSGGYYIYYTDDNGDNQYLTISNNNVYVSTTPYVLSVTTDTSGNVTIGFGSSYINYHGSDSNRVWYYSTATNLNLYYVDTTGSSGNTTTVKNVGSAITSSDVGSLDGEYIITGFDGYTGTYAYGAMTHTVGSGGMIPTNSSTITADDENIWIFESTTGGYYIYYLDDSGTKIYLNVADGNISTSTTAAVLTVSDDDGDGMVIIGDSTNSYQLNYYGNTQLVGEWNPGTELTIYTVETTTESSSTKVVEEVTSGTTSLDGDYIITGAASNNYATGVMTHETHSLGNGFTSDGSTGTPDSDSDTWTFDLQDDGTYYIYYEEGGTRYYLNITSASDSALTKSTTPQGLNVTINSSGKVVIGSSTYNRYINYYGQNSQYVALWTGGTNLTLYKVTEVVTSSGNVTMWMPSSSGELAPPVENGEYVIYSINYIAGSETKTNNSNTGLVRVAETPSNDVITTYTTNDWTFTLVDGTTNQYYIQNSEGKYLSIGTANGSVTLSDTEVALTVYGTTDNRVVIYKDSYVFDNFQDSNDMFSCWSSSPTSAGSNQIMTLYSKESGVTDVPANKQELYTALQAGIQHAPGTYSTASYQTLFDALEAGYEVFNNESATDEEIANATATINEAIAGLTIEYKYFPSTLYKYGYNPNDADAPYADGGIPFNSQTYESMEAIIRADDNLVAQIKTAIDYDGTNGTTWLDGEADTALDTAIAAYAQIYSISFTGAPVTNLSSVSEFKKTAWNVWTKTDTQGADESSDEGASVQGLFSALLVDGLPTDHADYNELPYGNIVDSRESFDTSAGISLTITANGAETTIASLPALQGISVHINDIFAKEEVLVDETDTTQGYSKFYWDLSFPLVTSTNEYGINTYSYSSYSTNYVFQATYNDDDNTATAQLTPVEEWSINRDGKSAGTGFFPFNYQNGTTTYTGENAVYHYGLTYTTDFYIPSSGTYADGEDVVFNFMGDDDVLVYIDDVLVLDNGGLHGARNASINFTDASVTYQYAMDVTEGTVKSTTEYGTTYAYGAANDGISADNLAALEKLNEVRTDGDYHTFTFYFLERGSTDSNFSVEFNIQEVSEDVQLLNQTLVLDYGLPIEFDITSNNFISADAELNGATTVYWGISASNTNLDAILQFAPPDNLAQTFDITDNTTDEVLNIEDFKYGTGTIDESGNLTYALNTVHLTGKDYFYTCAEVTNDPTYTEGTVYFVYEKTEFIPATSIYFEDNYGAELTFKDGTNAAGNDNGKWQTVGDASLFADAKQAADLAENSKANPYGYDPAYDNCAEYSGYSAQMVTVDINNNTSKGGTNPTFEFEFTGTGFDVISLTDNTTGVFYVEIFDANGERVGKRKVVDTYYGYSYGQLYADENGDATLTVTDKPFYKHDNGAITQVVKYFTADGTGTSSKVTYLDVSGTGYTETPTYYDADGNLTTTETENPAYAYAYAFGWLTSDSVQGLYQIPVIKMNGLDYGTYSVVITPMYTAMFDHNGTGEFNLYVDAIRIYDPAGKDDGVDSSILTEYKYDNESYPNYIEIKDMLIGADSLSEDAATQGVIFIDGIAALDNDLEKYKLAGPNNELYLANGQAVAFEIWATQVPDEVQLGIKSVQGTPTFNVTYGANSAEKVINTATEMNYIINSILPAEGKLTWTAVEVDGTTYYTTGTVVIQNTSADASILSVTSMKWTFTGVGQYGHYEVTTNEEVQNLNLMATGATISDAYSMMSAKNEETEETPVVPENPVEPESPIVPENPVEPDSPADDTPTNDNVTDNVADENTNTNTDSEGNKNQVVVNEPIKVTVTTSTSVTELIICDENGNVITPEELECAIETIDNKEVKVWTITLTETESGTYTYSVIGEFEDGTVEEQEKITVTVTAPEEDEGFFAKLVGFFEDIIEFFKNLIAKIDIS